MENLQRAVHSVLNQYAGFTGRATRAEFWWWALAALLFFLLLALLDALVVAPLFGLEEADPLSVIGSLAILLPNLAVAIRRLHDTGRSGWWLLISLIPVVGALVLIWFYVQPSEPGQNAHGPHRPW